MHLHLFVLFLQVSVILINLFTAVIIETFEKVYEQEEWKLTPQALEGESAARPQQHTCYTRWQMMSLC
jgi:hypothetical protein